MVALVLTMPAAATAQTAEKSPAALAKLVDCRAITDDARRLACFDREVAALDAAVRDRQVAVVERAEVRKARRSLFGISLPRIALLEDRGEPEVKEVTATIRSVGRSAEGRLTFVLEDGAAWAQTDDWPVWATVKPGQKVTLKRAAFGSYFADFEKAVTVRAKRLR